MMQEAIIYRSPLEAWLWNSAAGNGLIVAFALVWLVVAVLIVRHILRIARPFKSHRPSPKPQPWPPHGKGGFKL